MAYDSAFSPFGDTYLVGSSAVQVISKNNENPTSYRIRNLKTTDQYFSWAAPVPGGATITPVTPVAPSSGVPSVNTLGMAGTTTIVISGIPANAWFLSNVAAGFEITAGEGKL